MLDFRDFSCRTFTSGLDEYATSSNLYKLTNKLQQKRPYPLQLLHGPQGLVFSDEGKAKTFVLAMELQFSPNQNLDDPDIEDVVSHYFLTTPRLREIRSLLPHLKVKSAPDQTTFPEKLSNSFFLKVLPCSPISKTHASDSPIFPSPGGTLNWSWVLNQENHQTFPTVSRPILINYSNAFSQLT